MATPGLRFRASPDRLTDPRLEFLRSWWHARRGTRAMPSRADVSPSELRDYLGWITMVDVLPGGDDFRYRVVGTLVAEYFQVDGTGKTIRENFTTNVSERTREGVLDVYRWIVREKQLLRVHCEGGTLGRNLEPFSTLYMPLSDDGENVDTVMSGFVFDRSSVLMARRIAMANGGRLIDNPAIKKASSTTS